MGNRKTPIDWKTYNKELVNRGKKLSNSMKALMQYDPKEELQAMNMKKNGHPFVYSDMFVMLLTILKSVTGHGYRMSEGFAHLFSDKALSYSQLCRRINSMHKEKLESVNKKITKAITKGRTIDIIMDGTGIMVNGTYVWNDEKTGEKRKRLWKKLHIVIDRETKAILFLEVMDKDRNEAENKNMKETISDTLANMDDDSGIKRAFGDGLYDSYDNFDMLDDAGVELVTRVKKSTVGRAKRFQGRKISDLASKRFKSLLRNRVAAEQIDWPKYVGEHEFGKRSGIEGVIGSFKRLFKEFAYSKKDASIAREFLVKQITWNMMMF